MGHLKRVLGVLAVLAAAAWAVPAASGAAAPALTPQETQKAAALYKTAVGGDAASSLQAMKDLAAMGAAARPRLVNALRERLLRDKAAIEAAVRRIGDGAKARAAEEERTALRAAAVANLAKLAKDETLTIAHQNYDKLAALQSRLNDAYALRETIAAAMTVRAELMALWQPVADPAEKRLAPDVEDRLRASAEAVLGMTVEAMKAIPEFGQGKEPADAAARSLWFYRTCRRIEAYNRTVESAAGSEELECIRLLNAYRESLGILPLEIDARLQQSARRHSKEMVDLSYFAHDSPTASEKTHAKRMKNAGYTVGAYSENIAQGTTSGKGAFWMWFDSPPHHKNMVHASSTAIGVGRWGNTWTQNFGTGKRLMLASDADRAKAVVLGAVVAAK